MPDIYDKLPSVELLTNQFRFKLRYWQIRNAFINDMRNALGGLNEIQAPSSSQYVIKTLHTYILAALINEKTSRYLPRPVMQVIPDNPLDDESRIKSTRIEQGINVSGYEIERRGGGDCYDRAVRDALLLDMGVQKIIRGEAAYWPELVEHDRAWKTYNDNGKKGPKPGVSYSDSQRTELKRRSGIPITKDYVPLEFFLPHYDGKSLSFSFELTEVTRWGLLQNSTFQNEHGERVLKGLEIGKDGGLNETVSIVEYANDQLHAYFLAGPGPNSGRNYYPKLRTNTRTFSGELQCLYAYEHGIDRSIYNTYSGRFGGWKTEHNEIERVGKGIMELSQAADEIVSQVLTNVRATYWPSLNFMMDPEARGFGAGNSKPEAPKIKEGESIVTFVGEKIMQIFEAKDNPMAMWLYDIIQQQVSRLGGSATLFGERAPGVDTGFNQAIQQTQAQSLDNKQEQHLQAGAEEEALIISLHVKKINEPVEMVYLETDKKSKKKNLKYVTLDPKDLTPMPRFSAQVRKQGPMDYLSALRAFAMATDDRGGKGPAMSDESAREDILAMLSPDVEYMKILIESQKREMVANGFITDKVGDAANVKLAKHGTPEISPELMSKADPALLAAIQQIQPVAAKQGGTDPKLLGDLAEQQQPQGGGGTGITGPIPNDSEMVNRLGEAEQVASLTGAGI